MRCEDDRLPGCGESRQLCDNSILHTDHLLNRATDWLRGHDRQFETGLFYVNDHGESLGENGVYLHGLPRFMARPRNGTCRA